MGLDRQEPLAPLSTSPICVSAEVTMVRRFQTTVPHGRSLTLYHVSSSWPLPSGSLILSPSFSAFSILLNPHHPLPSWPHSVSSSS